MVVYCNQWWFLARSSTWGFSCCLGVWFLIHRTGSSGDIEMMHCSGRCFVIFHKTQLSILVATWKTSWISKMICSILTYVLGNVCVFFFRVCAPDIVVCLCACERVCGRRNQKNIFYLFKVLKATGNMWVCTWQEKLPDLKKLVMQICSIRQDFQKNFIKACFWKTSSLLYHLLKISKFLLPLPKTYKRQFKEL